MFANFFSQSINFPLYVHNQFLIILCTPNFCHRFIYRLTFWELSNGMVLHIDMPFLHFSIVRWDAFRLSHCIYQLIIKFFNCWIISFILLFYIHLNLVTLVDCNDSLSLVLTFNCLITLRFVAALTFILRLRGFRLIRQSHHACPDFKKTTHFYFSLSIKSKSICHSL